MLIPIITLGPEQNDRLLAADPFCFSHVLCWIYIYALSAVHFNATPCHILPHHALPYSTVLYHTMGENEMQEANAKVTQYTVQQLCQARLYNTRLWYFSIHFIKTQVELLTTLWHGYQFYMLNTLQVFLGIRHEKVKYQWSRLGVKSLSNKKPSYYWIIVSSIVLLKVVF